MIIKSLVKLGIKVLFLGTFGILIFSDTILASNVTAKSCSAADIQAAINACALGGGGTVTIPACDYTSPTPNGALWGANQKICIASTAELRVLGQGMDKTKIGYSSSGSGGYGNVCPKGFGNTDGAPIAIEGTGVKEFGQFTFDANKKTGGIIYWHGCGNDPTCANGQTNVRMHHIRLLGIPANGLGIYLCQNWKGVMVVDSSEFVNPDPVGTPGIYGISVVGGWGPESFVVPPVFGSNNGLFLEGNLFDGLYHSVAGFYATRVTARYNTIQNASAGIESHGSGYVSGCHYGDPPGGTESGYRLDYYKNDWPTGTRGRNSIMPRSGFWAFTENTVSKIKTGSEATILVNPDPGNTSPSIRTNCTVTAGCPNSYTRRTLDCFEPPFVWSWNNTTDPRDSMWGYSAAVQCSRVGSELFEHAPKVGDPIVTSYSHYTCPHPVAGTGTCSNTVTGKGGYLLHGGDIPTNPPPSAPKNLQINKP